MAKRPERKLTKRIIDSLTTAKPGGTRTYDLELRGFGVHTFPSGRQNFFLDYSAPNSRRRRRIKIGDYGALTLRQARDEARDVLGQVRKGIDPLEQRKQEREAGTFDQWSETYKALGKAAGRWVPRSFTEAERHLKRASEAFGHRSLDSIDATTIERWRDQLHVKHGVVTANRSLGTLKAALAEAWRRGLVPSNEASKVQRIAGELPRTRTLSESEMKALCKAIDAHDDPVFRVGMLWLVMTGARRSEVLRATWNDLCLDPPEQAEWTIPQPKNKRPSVRPIPEPLVHELLQLPRDSVLVVGKYSDNQFRRRWIKLRTAAKLPDDIHCHDLRRTAGLWAARVGGLQVAQKLLGHSNISTTAAVYTPLTTDDLRGPQAEVVAKILPFKQRGAADE